PILIVSRKIYFLRRQKCFCKIRRCDRWMRLRSNLEFDQPQVFPQGLLSRINEQMFTMKRRLFFLLSLASFACTLSASPTPAPAAKPTSTKIEKKGVAQVSPKDLLQSANGWNFVKGEWVHPTGFKIANGRIERTTARAGTQPPTPPGKLALQNPQAL